jgi:hypothetical protein
MNARTESDQPVPDPASEPTLEEQCRYLVERLKSRNPARRLRAARTLRDAPFPVVPLLVESLAEATPEHKEAVLATLGMLGRRARAAIPCVEELCEDEQLGGTARATLLLLRRRAPLDREAILRVACAVSIALLVALGVTKELGEWAGVWGDLQGPGRSIALGWGLIGGVGGYFAGARIPARGMAWKGAKILGVAGIYLGAVLGRLVGEVLAPLVAALGG